MHNRKILEHDRLKPIAIIQINSNKNIRALVITLLAGGSTSGLMSFDDL